MATTYWFKLRLLSCRLLRRGH